MQHLRDGDRLLGLTTLQPGWELRSDMSAAPCYAHGCLAEVTVQHSAPTERSVVIVRGLCRMRIEAEVTGHSLRMAEVVAVADRYPAPPAIDRTHRRDELLAMFQQVYELESLELFESLLRHELSLGCLTDVLAQSLPLPPATTAELLSISNVDLRSDLLLDYLRDVARRRPLQSTPAFSCN
jgi:Lon protease-like protein